MKPEPAAFLDRLRALHAGQDIVVCGHTRPDGDAMGSVLALTHALGLRGLNATPLLADNAPAPAPYAWLKGFGEYVQPAELNRSPDIFIALDTPDIRRLAAAADICQAATVSLLIDHHPQDGCYADCCYVDADAAATGQLVWQVLGLLGWERDSRVASCCYVALSSDTGGFQFANTTPAVFCEAADMVEAGADPAAIARALYGQKPLPALQLEARVLSRIRLLNAGAVVHSYLTDADLAELGVAADWTENLIDLIRVARDSEVAVFITHGSKGPRVSLRSAGLCDVSAVSRRFGGGGHRLAAGISWPEKTATRQQILEALLPLLPSFEE